MSLAAGLGSVTVKNATLYASSCEKQVAVRHCNGKDVWVVSHEYNTNNFKAYLLTSLGVSTNPVVSSIGETPVGAYPAIGHLKISPDGKRLAMATASSSIPTSLGLGGFHLFDFDAATGVVSNSLTLNTANLAYGVEFSPDGSMLYGVTGQINLSNVATLYQWNLCVSSPSAIASSQYSLSLGTIAAGSLQRAIDDKIYLAVTGQQSLSVINNPNANGIAMNFVLNGQNLAPKVSGIGLPNHINPYTKPSPLPFNNTVACQSASFAAVQATFNGGCSIASNPVSAYVWDFGEPTSGAANSSTLSNPNHMYATTGAYTVSLVLVGPCTNDTVKKVISITTLGPKPDVAGTFTICKGDKYTYTASGGSTYNWSNNTTAATVALNPSQTTVYSVASSSNGCSLSKSFTVTVNACLGIGDVASSASATGEVSGIRIYPNPIKDILFIEAATQTQLYIFDITGKQVLEAKLNAGQNKLNAENLPAGVYSLKTIGVIGNWHGRVVKME
jgi:PKD repeat protein